MTNPSPKRGEIWLSNLNPTQGSEQAGIRPVIIFQNDVVSQFYTTSIAIYWRFCHHSLEFNKIDLKTLRGQYECSVY